MTKLTDEEVLAASKAQFPSQDDRRFSELLWRQRSGTLTDSEQAELARLMTAYGLKLLDKAQALNEAVQRGLLPPLED